MEPKKVRQIFLLLDSDQPGEQSAALSRLRALKAQGQPVLRDVFDLFDKVAEVAEERDKLKQENVTLAARVRLGRPSLWRTIKTHARTSAIAVGVVLVLGGGFHFIDVYQRNAQGEALRLELQHRLDRALAELVQQRHAPPVSPSRPSDPPRPPPAKDRIK